MTQTIAKIADIFGRMVANYNDMGRMWRNIPLAREAFALMRSLPPTVEGEFDTPAAKASLLAQMLDHTDEYMTPRFSMEVRSYMHSLNPDDSDNEAALRQLHDFTDLSLPMEEYCRRYRRHLRFDPVERTARWEEVIYDIERQCDERLADCPRGMGFCHAHWHEKAALLRAEGIDWASPAVMNPRVMFD